jgi:hypothetical protein
MKARRITVRPQSEGSRTSRRPIHVADQTAGVDATRRSEMTRGLLLPLYISLAIFGLALGAAVAALR